MIKVKASEMRLVDSPPHVYLRKRRIIKVTDIRDKVTGLPSTREPKKETDK